MSPDQGITDGPQIQIIDSSINLAAGLIQGICQVAVWSSPIFISGWRSKENTQVLMGRIGSSRCGCR
jgi:hypothetical protein